MLHDFFGKDVLNVFIQYNWVPSITLELNALISFIVRLILVPL